MTKITVRTSDYSLNEAQLERVKGYVTGNPEFSVSVRGKMSTLYDMGDGLFGVMMLREGSNPSVRLLTVCLPYRNVHEKLAGIIGGAQ